MRKYFLLICLHFFCLSFLAQHQTNADSLKQIIAGMPDDSMKVKKIIKLTMNLISIGKYDDAETYLKQSQAISEKENFKKGLGATFNYRGIICDDRGQMAMALENYFKALKIFNEIKNYGGQADCYNNIGIIYLNQNELNKALTHLTISEKYATLSNKRFLLDNPINNIGSVYFKKKDFKNALTYYYKAYELRKELGFTEGCIESLNNLANVYNILGDTAQALINYHVALELARNEKNNKSIAITENAIGIVYFHQDFKKSIPLLEDALRIAEEINLNEVKRDANKLLSDIYLKLNNTGKALGYYKNFIAARDTFFNEENTKNSVRLEMNYEFEKKEANAIAEQDKKDAIAVAESKRQKIVLILVSFVLLLVAVVAFVVFRSLRITRKQKNIIETQKTEVEKAKLLVEERNKDITDSINYAKRIQEAILPDKEIKYRIFPDAFVLFQPCRIVSGDFYWFTEKNGRRLIAAVDCTGHGVPGAFMSMIGNTFLHEIVNEKGITQPDLILNELRQLIITSLKQSGNDKQNKDGMDMAVLSFDDKNGIVEFAGANNPVYLIRSGTIRKIEGNKQPIGYYFGKSVPFTNHKIEIKKEDSLYILSDGITDQFGGKEGKKFMNKQLQEILLSIQDKPMLEQENILLEIFKQWKGDLEQTDDVLVIGIKV